MAYYLFIPRHPLALKTQKIFRASNEVVITDSRQPLGKGNWPQDEDMTTTFRRPDRQSQPEALSVDSFLHSHRINSGLGTPFFCPSLLRIKL
jgi:hypothetical protein